jgi:serine/threonine protein kinase
VPELKLESSIVDDRYQVESCLGRGSYAEIFLAYDRERGGETVIIKALNTTLQGTIDTDLEWTLIENFQNEAVALDKVRHPNVIQRLGHGTAADLAGTAFHYLVLEFMPGGDMLTLCRERRLTLDETLFYFEQVARALANAHTHNVIHRDVKPNNLLLSEDRRIVKIADFGVAKMTMDDDVEITRVGTNVYAPPEHHPDAPAAEITEKLAPAADVYSLAKTIYTSITGRAPRQFARQPISELPRELAIEPWADELLRILGRATASRVADRYQSIQDLWQDLGQLPASGQSDPEATLVRARLGTGSVVVQVAEQPEFQPLAPLHHQNSTTPRARIVVDLPSHEADQSSKEASANPAGDAGAVFHAPAVGGSSALATRVREPETLSRPPALQPPIDENAPSVFDRLHVAIRSEWLRGAFILFLIAALIGLAASTYFYFAGENVPIVGGVLDGEDGLVAGATNVNLRSDPNRQAGVLAVLPEGTRVRAFESRDGWRRVKVIEWVGVPPDNAHETGWVDSRFIRLD